MRSFLRSRLVLALFLAWTASVAAHDIPSDVTVQLIVKPTGRQLQMLVRVPLGAIRDIDFPEREGHLDIAGLAPQLPGAARLWISDFVSLYEGKTRLGRPRVIATQISLPSDRSFTSFETAFRHVNSPQLPNSANVFWQQVLFDVLFEYSIDSENSEFSIRPGLERLGARVVTVLRFLPPGGAVRAYEFLGDPGVVHLDPSWHQAAGRFVELGFQHILDGTDHLLFLLCLVLPLRRFRPLLTVVTAFTLAHSVTLIAAAYGFVPDTLWFPPLIESLIAVSIVYMALENIINGSATRHRWMIAFGFGLVHGFGFSFALRENLQFAGSHLLSSLLAFNIGVELAQIFVLLLLIPLLAALFRFVVAERMGTIIVSALVAHTGVHWIGERVDRLRQFSFEWPPINAAGLASAMRWLLAILIVAALAVSLFSRWREARRGPSRVAEGVE